MPKREKITPDSERIQNAVTKNRVSIKKRSGKI